MSNLIIIPARKGSKGIKNKNKIEINGKKLIEYTFEVVKKINFKSEICLTTDDKDIIKIAKKFEIPAPFIRPANISKDTSTIIEVIEHALNWYKKNQNYSPKNIILLQPTSPGRELKDILNAYKMFSNSNKKSLISVSIPKNDPCEIFILRKNKLKFLLKTKKNSQRQQYPESYFVDGSIYIFKTSFFTNNKRIFDQNSIFYKSQSKHLIDIDTYEDLKIFKYLQNR